VLVDDEPDVPEDVWLCGTSELVEVLVAGAWSVPAPVDVDEPLGVALGEPGPVTDVEVATGASGVPVAFGVEPSAVGAPEVELWVVVPFPAFAFLAG
jgi:hypothetical protein